MSRLEESSPVYMDPALDGDVVIDLETKEVALPGEWEAALEAISDLDPDRNERVHTTEFKKAAPQIIGGLAALKDIFETIEQFGHERPDTQSPQEKSVDQAMDEMGLKPGARADITVQQVRRVALRALDIHSAQSVDPVAEGEVDAEI